MKKLNPIEKLIYFVKLIWLTFFNLIKQALLLPRNAALARQRQVVLSQTEAERLDRIRFPAKYIGK
jgi:hypothetical protein